MHIDFASHTHIGHIRSSNQDALGCFPELGLFVVADGMGGHPDGAEASRMAIVEIPAAFEGNLSGATHTAEPGEELATQSDIPLRALQAAIRCANDRIHAAGAATPEVVPMGTTVVALHVDDDALRVRWAHVGDSRLYRLRGKQFELLTTDHTRLGQPYSGLRATPIDLPHTNELLSALGVTTEVTVSISDDDLRAGDRFLLCSDGVSGMLPSAALQLFLGNANRADQTAIDLIEGALGAGGRDNASVVVIQVD